MKFLIADDEQLVRLTIRTILNNYGIENQDIYQAGTGREMLAVLSEHRVDLAFVDIRMPEMTGLEAIRQSIALSGHTSFYILTGYDRFEYAREAISIGVKDFLLKPLETHTVEEILKRERAHQESARRQIRSEFASLVSSALLTGSGSASRPLFCLPCLCTFDRQTDVDVEFFCRCEDVFTSVHTVILPFPHMSYVVFCSAAPFSEKPLLAQIHTLFSSAAESRGWETASAFCFSAAVSPAQLAGAFSTLKRYAAVRLTHGLRRFYTVSSSHPPVSDSRLLPAVLILQLRDDYLGGSYVDYVNHLEQLTAALKNAPDLFGRASLHNINAWLSLCFARPETPLDSPEGFYRHFQALSRRLLSPGEQKMSSLESIIRYTDDHYTEDISVNGLADQFGLTPNYLSAQFKRETGMKFTDYVTGLRLAQAKKLLVESPLQVKQIASRVGYYTTSHFIKAFVRREEMTPLEYRNRYKTVKPEE